MEAAHQRSNNGSWTANRPCLFLFDGGAEGVPDSPLMTFTESVLAAISNADPEGTLVAELRGGLPSLTEFAEQTTAVSSEPMRSSHTISHDMALYKLMLWDFSEALSEGEGAPAAEAILDVLRLRREECLALSHLPDALRVRCEAHLRSCPGFVGICPIDVGNPLLRRAFFDGLMHFALIDGGQLIQERSMEGEDVFVLQGAVNFRPRGLTWGDNRFGTAPPAKYRIGDAPVSSRGAVSLERLRGKRETTVERRVFEALSRSSWTTRSGATYSFATAEAGTDILQAMWPEGKFTGYLFNRDHEKGGGKAKFIMDVLGFDPQDWRFLAAQFYDGLLLSEPRDLELKRWANGYGAQFNNLVEVTSRQGNKAVMKTGWMLEPQRLPKLSTAFPAKDDGTVVRPPIPPVLLPMISGDARWEALFDLADGIGRAAHDAAIPTPMLLQDFGVMEEGEIGSAFLTVADARTGFARWLVKSGRGDRGYKGGAEVWCNVSSQSADRARAYINAFSRTLALNGIRSQVTVYLS